MDPHVKSPYLENIYWGGAQIYQDYDEVIKWKHFPCYWPFVRGIHRSLVNSPYKGQWRGALMFSLICARINDWVNNREAGDLRRRLAHYDVTVMTTCAPAGSSLCFRRLRKLATITATEHMQITANGIAVQTMFRAQKNCSSSVLALIRNPQPTM